MSYEVVYNPEGNANMSEQRESSPAPTQFILSACVISFLLIFLVYTKNFVFGSSEGGWVYPYFGASPTIPRWILLAVFILLSLAIFIGSRSIIKFEKITVFAGFLIAILLQSLLHLVYPFSLGAIVQSDVANSFYSDAILFPAREILSKFLVLLPSLSSHSQTNMPGKILLYEFLKLLTTSPEVMGYLIIVISSLGALLIYGIGKQLFHDKLAGFYGLILYALVPCKIFFLPILNVVSPVTILLCFYLFLVFLEKKRSWILWLLGVVLYLTFLFEPTPLVMGILFLGFMVYAFVVKELAIKDSWRLAVYPILSFAGVYFIFRIFFSFDLFQVFRYLMTGLTPWFTNVHRSYQLWIGENLKEFFYVTGLPVMIIFIYMAAQFISQWKTFIHLSHWSRENILVASLLATLVVVDLLGLNRGEITRLWIFLAVFFQIPAASFIAKNTKGAIPFFLVALTLAAQVVITLHRVAFVRP